MGTERRSDRTAAGSQRPRFANNQALSNETATIGSERRGTLALTALALPRRPRERPATEQVDVKVWDRLAAIASIIDDQAKATLAHS